MQLRITIVTGPFFSLPPAPFGAIERVWFDLGKTFAAKGHEVTFVARSHPEQGPGGMRDGVRFIFRKGSARSGKLSFDLLKDFIYSLRVLWVLPRADITITNVFWLPWLASWLRRRAGKIVVNLQRVPKGQLKLYRRCARLAVVSEAIRDDVARQYPAALPITRVIPNPINIDVFTPPPERSSNGEQTLLYTGRVHPEKGLHLLIDAFRRVHATSSQLKLRIIGPSEISRGGGGPEYVADLKRRAEGLPVEIAAPIYDRPALADAYRAAHYYCYPSLAEKGESFGVAPLEAMATGLAPIVSDLACFRDFIDEGNTGIFFDYRGENAEANLAAAIESMVNDPQRAARMGAAAAQAARRFGYDAVAEMYLADFRDLLGEKSFGEKTNG